MKQFIIVLVLSAIFSNFLPWWIVAPISFAVAFRLEENILKSFIISFAAILVLWGGLAFWMDIRNDSLLSERVSQMIIKSESSFVMISITALIGGLVAGFGALSGSLLKKARK